MHYLSEIIITFGYIGIFTTIFAESGFLLGFFLPGDSLLFTVGLLAAENYFSITVFVVGSIIAAILGDSFGYYCGKRFGPKIFKHEDSLLFRKQHVEETRLFFEKYGKKAIILARFVPIVRTFTPIMAGVGKMEYKTFLAYNIVGGMLWAGGFLLAAYFLGTKVPGIEKYTTYIIIGIIILSFAPFARKVLQIIRSKIK